MCGRWITVSNKTNQDTFEQHSIPLSTSSCGHRCVNLCSVRVKFGLTPLEDHLPWRERVSEKLATKTEKLRDCCRKCTVLCKECNKRRVYKGDNLSDMSLCEHSMCVRCFKVFLKLQPHVCENCLICCKCGTYEENGDMVYSSNHGGSLCKKCVCT